jgi:hypothetical protein
MGKAALIRRIICANAGRRRLSQRGSPQNNGFLAEFSRLNKTAFMFSTAPLGRNRRVESSIKSSTNLRTVLKKYIYKKKYHPTSFLTSIYLNFKNM